MILPSLFNSVNLDSTVYMSFSHRSSPISMLPSKLKPFLREISTTTPCNPVLRGKGFTFSLGHKKGIVQKSIVWFEWLSVSGLSPLICVSYFIVKCQRGHDCTGSFSLSTVNMKLLRLWLDLIHQEAGGSCCFVSFPLCLFFLCVDRRKKESLNCYFCFWVVYLELWFLFRAGLFIILARAKMKHVYFMFILSCYFHFKRSAHLV